MDNPLQTRPEWFIRCLAETAAWCLRGTLLNNVPESEEIRERRALGRKAAELSRESFLKDRKQFWKSSLYAKASGMFAQARLEEIAPLDYQLRSPVLKPEQPTSRLETTEWQSVVDRLSAKRAHELRSANCYPENFEDPAHGRLLIYFPEENLFDGAAKYSSKGFFDVDNTPPWNTWVCFFDRKLVTWVPDQLVDLANQGVDVNPEQCIQWADQLINTFHLNTVFNG